MRRTALLLSTLVAATGLHTAVDGQSGTPAPAVKTIAVFDFDNHSGQSKYDPLGKGIAAMMITDLGHVSGVRLVERERLQGLLSELQLQQTENVDPATAGKLGRILGAEYVVLGALSAIDPRIQLDTRVVRVETSEVVKTAEVRGREDKFFELQEKLAKELIDGLQIALSPEERERFEAQQKANRIEELRTALAFSEAIALFEREEYVDAIVKMQSLVRASPGSTLLRLTLDSMQQRATEAARNRTRDKAREGVRNLLRKRFP